MLTPNHAAPQLQNTARMGRFYCLTCGWPVVTACCNDAMGELHPDSDWWAYCSNQGCARHPGTEMGQHANTNWMAAVPGA